MLALAAGSSQPSDLDDTATALISDLALPSLAQFSLQEDVAVVVQLEGDLARVMGGLLLARLSALGASHAILIDAGPDADARARRAGAEWLLAVRGEAKDDALSLFAELRAIDRGIWSMVPDPNAVMIVATAEHRSAVAVIPKPVDPPPTSDRARLEGPAIRILTVPERVLALRACRLSQTETDDLVVLTANALAVYSLLDGRITRSALHELKDLPRHKMPAREPIGSIACRSGRIAFGHSGLAQGHLLSTKTLKKKLVLEPAGELAGIPIASLPKDRWLLAQTESGTSRYQKALRAVGAEGGPVELPRAILDAAAFEGEAPEGWRLLAVTDDYQLLRLDDRLAEPARVGASGVGISVFAIEGRPHVITTGANLDNGRDQLALFSGGASSRPVPVEGQVFATSVGRFRGSALDLVAASQANDRTDLFLLRLWEPK
jgi:hypothetical protein